LNKKENTTTVELVLDLQNAYDGIAHLPEQEDFERWVSSAISPIRDEAELTIRIVGDSESQQLNAQYRGKDKPTNVLSFPADLPKELELPLLGDLVISADIVQREATEQGKSEIAHWAHMSIHGALHLLGYDHIDDAEAEEMESLETRILADLGFANPYE